MAAIRQANAVWNGGLADGSGSVSAATSGKFMDLDVTWPSRSEEHHGGRTSPEELLAASHASCFAMALSHVLGSAGTPPERLEVTASVTFDQVGDGFGVISSALTVRGKVAGIDADAFGQAAEGAKDSCPISGAMKGNVALSVEAVLDD